VVAAAGNLRDALNVDDGVRYGKEIDAAGGEGVAHLGKSIDAPQVTGTASSSGSVV